MTARSRSIRRDARAAALLACALPFAPAHAGNGWFAHDCGRADQVFPATPQRQLLRVLSGPRDDGVDQMLLRTPNGQLYALREFFEQLAIHLPPQARREGNTAWYALDAVDGLRYQLDPCAQTLSVDASRLRATDVRTLSADAQNPPATSEPGSYAQADLQYLHDGSADTVSGIVDAGLFGGFGEIRNGVLYDGRRAVRLDTRWTMDDPLRLHRLRLGDGIARGGSFGRALRFGGVQWGTEFSLQPDVVTFPLPGLGGLATLPSAVDVYVNDSLRAHDSVDAGPFQLDRIPVITGSGQMQLVVTDLLGRSTVYRYDFYVAPQLLRAGLDDYGVEAGSLRLDYGRESLHYDDAFVAGTWRHGQSDWLTTELHAESSERRQFAGAGAAYLLPALGVLSGGIASGAGDSHGVEINAAVERSAPRWSYALSYTRTPATLLRVGETRPASLQRLVARGSWQVRGFGALSLAWLDDRAADDTRRRGLNAGFNASLLRQLSLYVGAYADVDRAARNTLYASVNVTFGRQLYGNASWQHDDGGDVARFAVQRARTASIGWDGGAYVERGARERYGGNASFTDAHAIGRVDVEHGDDDDAVRFGLRSGFVTLGPDLFWSRPIDGPFAVVETDSDTPVRVYDENRLVGAAAAGHALLIPELRAYESRQLAVADADYAIDTRLDERERRIVAPGYGGVRVRFDRRDASPMRRLRLQLADGRAPPPGSDVAVSAAAPTFTGLHGELLLSAPAGRHRLDVRWEGGTCSAEFVLAAGDRLSDAERTVPCRLSP